MNWKTKAEGILSLLITTLTVLAGVQVPAALQPNGSKTLLYIQFGIILALALCNAWIRWVQNYPATPAAPQQALRNGTYITGPGQKLGALMLIALLYPLCLMPWQVQPVSGIESAGMIACTPGQVQNEINTILQEATGIIAVADPGATWLADFSKAAALLKVDEANWIKGGAVQDVINVLNDLQGVTALISPLVPYASLIGVLVAGIDAVLALLLPAPTGGAVTAQQATPRAPNPFKGRETVTSAKQSKALWNGYVAANPALASARI
jgi:hypothetical protein